MVRMSDIWDRTTEVLRGRSSMLAGIAALLVFVPAVVQAGAQFFLTGGGLQGFAAGATSISSVVAVVLAFLVVFLLVMVVRLWGSAAIISAGSDPAYDRSAAMAHGARRLPAALGVSLLFVLAILVLFIPFFVLIGASFNWAALARGVPPDPSSFSSPGSIIAALFYGLVLFFVLFFVLIRLSLLMPVIVNERLGAGAIGRSWRLTQGLFWRLFGVFFLFGLVFLIATSAATLLMSLLVRLLLGASHVGAATFAGQIGGAAVGAAYAVVSGVFLAQLYRALTGREAAETFA